MIPISKVCAAVPVLLVAVTSAATPAAAFSASFTWEGTPRCSSTSPAFTIRSAPQGTTQLRFSMSDYDAPNFRHGGATIAYGGRGNVPRGAIAYIGPCPPTGQTHRYIWTIEALDGTGSVLARTRTEGRFPPR
jgi:phosphatidylethanolamine-binding protein (PEBP) family uncharacterized protein